MHEDQHIVIFKNARDDYQVYHVEKATSDERRKLAGLEYEADEQDDGWIALRDYVKQLRSTEYPAGGFFEYGSARPSLYVQQIWVRAQVGESSLVRCQTPAHAQELYPLILERFRSADSGLAIDSQSMGMMQILGRSYNGRPFHVRLCADSKIPAT